MRRLPTCPGTALARWLFLCLCAPAVAWASEPEPVHPYAPHVAPASREAEQAFKAIRVPSGLQVGLFAAEPLVANPVAFGFDERGRVYVVETFRLHHGVTDTRGHMSWLDDDMACRTVDDRVAMYKNHLGRDLASYATEHDRLRLVEDRDGDGKADHATVFADGFHHLEDGLAAGVLARGDDVWFTCIPDLWRFRDTDGDGQADVRTSLHRGYGVHVNFIGHDLHGLRFGPDGKLYFSIGDRGLNVKTADRTLVLPDTGAVLRCNPDGSDLEIFATGLRNPQELAFDEFGNLFTGDNNSDSGDRARWVYVVEGGDSGWRIGYQYLQSPVSRGPWNAEKLWHPQFDGQAAYLVPPIANLADGPSGLTYNPGVTQLPERYRRHFFLCDFRGSSGQSGVRAITLEPKGASFRLVENERFAWGFEATDVDFGPDGTLYMSDWVEGWGLTGKGRLYKVSDPALASSKAALEVKSRLAAGFTNTPLDELANWLAHDDARIRQEAQFQLAARGPAARSVLERTAKSGPSTLGRIHAIWGLGQLGRVSSPMLDSLASLLTDHDPEVRAQAVKVLGDGRRKDVADRLTTLLRDDSPRVRFFAANALGKVGERRHVAPLLDLLRENADRDPYLRHAAVMGLTGIKHLPALLDAARDSSASVRMGVLLALRRLERPEVGQFLQDAEARLVLEAARAIYDVPIASQLPALAALGERPGLTEPLLRRVVNAQARLGKADDAEALARLAARIDIPEPTRVEALDRLRDWPKPIGRDPVMGLWRPVPGRPAADAARALRPILAGLVQGRSESIRAAALQAVGPLAIDDAGPLLEEVVRNAERSVTSRLAALQGLDQIHDLRLASAVTRLLEAREAKLRIEAQRLLVKLQPDQAAPLLKKVLANGTMAEKQSAFSMLGGLPGTAADEVLLSWLDQLNERRVAAELELDLLEAAAGRSSPEIASRLRRLEAERPKDDVLAAYREALVGGDRLRGWKIVSEKAEVSCLRCHKVRGRGGEVGPDLKGIGARQDRRYLLESIVAPNRQIAKGFETLIVATRDGQLHTGILKEDDGKALRLVTPEGQVIRVPKADIEEQKRGGSAMPEDLLKHLSKAELRDVVEFLATLK